MRARRGRGKDTGVLFVCETNFTPALMERGWCVGVLTGSVALYDGGVKRKWSGCRGGDLDSFGERCWRHFAVVNWRQEGQRRGKFC